MTESPASQSCDDSLRVLYSGSCPICSKEIEHYQRYSDGKGLPIAYDDLMTEAREAWTIDQDSAAKGPSSASRGRGARRRRCLPCPLGGHASLSTACALSALARVFTLARWVYDGVLAPALFRFHQRRERRA